MKDQYQQIIDQNHNRKRWRENDSPETLIKQIVEEALELEKSAREFESTQNAEYHLVGEIGDVLYLTLKLCDELGIRPEDALELKLLRNSVKYPDHLQSNGWDYRKARETSQSLWQNLGGDNAFFLWHSLLFPIDD
jgi:NTP pyrophosphatase (non-canonical NTP hydrolase)